MRRVLMLASLGMVLPLFLNAQSRCEYGDVIELSTAAGEELLIVAGAGSLEVTGDSGGDVRVTATLCASEEEWLRELDATLEHTGARMVLDTHYPDRGSWGDRYARIDLTVQVPETLSVEVEDGSGSARISQVGRLRVTDGSGDLTIRGAGDVVVNDGSGSVIIEGVTGHVELYDGSGSVEIEDVTGDVWVDDGSGEIEIRSVGGSVRVEEMGSGQLRVDGVRGDLIVEDGRYERIRHSNVEGELRLPEPRRRRGS